MKIFVSSLIAGYQEFRAAARSAITTLRHEPIMAEDFGSRPHSPQLACLQAIRGSDMVVLILGERYGVIQGTSGLSPTHEEYMEARGTKPILMFVEEDVTRDERQSKFLSEVEGWQHGYFRAGFRTADELKALVIRAIHDYQLATATGPIDVGSLSNLASALLPTEKSRSGAPALNCSIVGAPAQRILRPSELESATLATDLHRQALFGNPQLFVSSKGTEIGIVEGALRLQQPGGAMIRLNEQGGLLLRLPLEGSQEGRPPGFSGMFAVIEEDVMRELCSAIAYGAWVLERVDPTQRLVHIAIAASVDASEYLGWRTRAQQDASPTSGTMRVGSNREEVPVHLDRPRAALRFEAKILAEDLMIPLRRQRSS